MEHKNFRLCVVCIGAFSARRLLFIITILVLSRLFSTAGNCMCAELSELDLKGDRMIDRFYFPPPGQGLDKQDPRQPEKAGLDPAIVEQINNFAGNNREERGAGASQRWALWRHGYLIH